MGVTELRLEYFRHGEDEARVRSFGLHIYQTEETLAPSRLDWSGKYPYCSIRVSFSSVRISPGVSREKQNSNCKREKYLFCEAVDNLLAARHQSQECAQ